MHPTAGFSIREVTFSSIANPILVYDCSGHGRHRHNWWTFFSYVTGVIFVIDSLDVARFALAKDRLFELASDSILRDRRLPLVIMLNKHDKSEVPKEVYARGLELDKLKASFPHIYVKETSGFKKEGLQECFEWLCKAVRFK